MTHDEICHECCKKTCPKDCKILAAFDALRAIVRDYNEQHDSIPAKDRPLNYDFHKTRAGCACGLCQRARQALV
jgi:hypothetical protein